MTAVERLMAKVDLTPDGCWVWTACVDRAGYGRFKLNGSCVLAHRASYELHVGPPPGMLDHRCRNRACINPEHLEPVTNAENQARGERATRTHCLAGHAYDDRNTYRGSDGSRVCRACRRDHCLKRKAARSGPVRRVSVKSER